MPVPNPMANRKEKEPPPPTPPTFENAIAQLETIVEQMESDNLALEDLLVRFEEGLKLVKFCTEKLESAEKRIELIARDSQGKTRLVEFEPARMAAAPRVTSASGETPSAAMDAVALIPAKNASSSHADTGEESESGEDVRLF